MENQQSSGRLPARQKYAFGIGAIGKDAICNLVGAFLMLYFTDTLGLSAAFVGVLFFAARIWDAVNDPMMDLARHWYAGQLGVLPPAVHDARH